MTEKDHQLGDAPIEAQFQSDMIALATAIDEIFNGDLKAPNKTTGFVLLVFPYGEREGRCNYISNGANRADMVRLLREQANRFEETEKGLTQS
jgi:hypothetical protein